MMICKKGLVTALLLSGMVTAGIAQADAYHTRTTTTDQYSDPNAQDPAMDPAYHQEEQQSVAQNNYKETNGTLRDETWALSPELGMVSYTNPNGAYTAKALAGIGLSVNLMPYFGASDNRNWYLGLVTGAEYSHNGSDSSNFFGANAAIGNHDNSNLLIIPADLKLGYNVTPSFRVSAHGGGNVIYRSVASSIFLGDGSSGGTDSNWKIFPNVGADLEFQAATNVSIGIRPDVTITPGVDVVSAVLGINFINL